MEVLAPKHSAFRQASRTDGALNPKPAKTSAAANRPTPFYPTPIGVGDSASSGGKVTVTSRHRMRDYRDGFCRLREFPEPETQEAQHDKTDTTQPNRHRMTADHDLEW